MSTSLKGRRNCWEILLPAVVIAGALLYIFSPQKVNYNYLFSSQMAGYNKPSPWLISAYEKQSVERRQKLKGVTGKDAVSRAHLYNNLAPEVYCAEKIKVGTTDDGGKWMCSPKNLPADCVIFALGISNVITYEEELQNYSNSRCRIISVDYKKQKNDVIKRIGELRGVVVEAKIGAVDNKTTRTMASILKEHKADKVEILKMDIEGAEWATSESFLKEYQPAQFLVELHGTPKQVYEYLQMMATKGYLLFHHELNGRYTELCEYAFIHEDSLERYEATLLARYLKP